MQNISAFIKGWQLLAVGVTWPFWIMWHQLEVNFMFLSSDNYYSDGHDLQRVHPSFLVAYSSTFVTGKRCMAIVSPRHAVKPVFRDHCHKGSPVLDTIYSWKKVPHFNAHEPVTKRHLPCEIISMAKWDVVFQETDYTVRAFTTVICLFLRQMTITIMNSKDQLESTTHILVSYGNVKYDVRAMYRSSIISWAFSAACSIIHIHFLTLCLLFTR